MVDMVLGFVVLVTNGRDMVLGFVVLVTNGRDMVLGLLCLSPMVEIWF